MTDVIIEVSGLHAAYGDEDVLKGIDIVVERLGFDHERTLACAFAQAVLSAVWSVADGCDPMRGLATARVMMTML